MASDIVGDQQKLKERARDFVESQLQKRMFSERTHHLMKKNLDALNMPTQIEQMFPEKVGVYD